MYAKIFLNLFFILLLGSIELSFISGLPLGLNDLNLVFVIFIFILVTVGLNFALWWALGIGVLLDVFSFLPFGVHIISLMLGILALNIILNFFTNRSLYSLLVAMFFGTIVYEIIFNLVAYAITIISGREFVRALDGAFWRYEMNKVVFNMISVLIIFYTLNFLSNRLKPVFLIKR